MDHNKLWKVLREMGILDHHLTCPLRNLHSGQEAPVRTGHGTTDWFQIRKGVRQGCISSLCLFNLHAEYIMQNAGLDEAQAGIKIVGRNINNHIYADDTTLMAESEEVKSSDTSSIETVYNSQDMEVTYMPISRRMDKEVMVHIHNGILLSY